MNKHLNDISPNIIKRLTAWRLISCSRKFSWILIWMYVLMTFDPICHFDVKADRDVHPLRQNFHSDENWICIAMILVPASERIWDNIMGISI